MGKKSKSSEKREKKSKSKEKTPKKSKSKEKKSKEKKSKKDKKDKDDEEGNGDGGLGFEVKLEPYSKFPTEEDLRRFGPLSIEVKQAHTAIVLLDSEEDHVLIESLLSLQRFCSKRYENRELFVMLGGYDRIVKFFHHPHLIIQRLALKIFAIISSVHRVKLLCRDNDMAQELKKFGQSEDPFVLEYVATILSNLSTLYAGRLQIIRHGGVPFLLNLVQHADPDVQRTSVECLLNLLQEPLHDQLLLKPEVMASFYNLIDSEHPRIQIVALSILEKLTRRPSTGELVRETGIIQNIASKLDNELYSDLHRVYLQILVNLSQDVTNCENLSGLLGQLCTLLDDTLDIQVLNQTMTLLGRMARLPLLAKSLINFYEIIPKLIFIVSNYADTDLRSAAAYTAAQIASTAFQAKLPLAEIFEPLHAFFFDLHATVSSYQNIMLAASVILENDECGQKFLDAGGLDMIEQVCNSEAKHAKYSYHTIISALSCVNTLGRIHHFRKAMVSHGVLPTILNQMTSRSGQVVTLAATALSTLLCIEEGRHQFLARNGYSYVVTAFKNREFNVALSMSPLISAIGSYPEIGIEMVNNGFLTVMWERPDLISTNGPMRVAFERLISTHLPAKFAYKGHISAYEKLQHGFYDIGILPSNQSFVPLEQVKYDDRANHHKPIYVNFNSIADPKLFLESPFLETLASEEVPSVMDIVTEVRNLIPENVRSEKDLVGLIATVVCEKFGGPLDKWRVSAEAEEIELANFQSKHSSLVVPLTCISTGAHRPRAILFKALADIFGIPSTLDRGGFKKCWNVVLIRAKKMHTCCPCPETPEDEHHIFFTERLRRFVVDLLYTPGTLFPLYSYEADTYCFC